jgi:hypothetical protein
MVDEEALQKFKRDYDVPEDADVPPFDGLPPLTRAVVRRALYEWDCRVQNLRDGIGPECAAVLQEQPPDVAKKSLETLFRYEAGDPAYVCHLGAFLGFALEERPERARGFLAALAGVPPDSPEMEEILSATWELVNCWVDGIGTPPRLLEGAQRNGKPISGVEYFHRLGLPDIYFREFRRHLANRLGARQREDSPREEMLASPRKDSTNKEPEKIEPVDKLRRIGANAPIDEETPDSLRVSKETPESVFIDEEARRELIKRHSQARLARDAEEDRRVLEIIAEGVGNREACREAGVSSRVIERIRDRERRKREREAVS